MGQTARTDREIDADFATVTISLPSIESLLIGRSRKMAEVRRLIARVARSQASVLVTGPSGSGKEVVARCLHEASSRRGASFVAVNCGALPRELLESEQIGHEKGALTGALHTRKDRFEAADGRTRFLAEIGVLQHDTQVNILRF